MKNLCVVPLCLDAWSTNNWNLDAQPVASLNEASTLHERVAYCHGLAHGMQKVAELLYENDSEGVASAAGFFFSQITPLVAMLERMGADTYTAERKLAVVAPTGYA